jgi:hypothetical protein
MKTANKMMIAVGALALTATTLLAGCGGSSTASTPASASASAAAEVPTSVLDGVVQPSSVSDDVWAEFTNQLAAMDEALKTVTPDEVSEICALDKEELRASIGFDDSQLATFASGLGGSVEEWSAASAKYADNTQRIACSLAK